MRRIFKVGFYPKNVPKVILLTGPKFQFNSSNGTKIIQKIIHVDERLSLKHHHILKA